MKKPLFDDLVQSLKEARIIARIARMKLSKKRDKEGGLKKQKNKSDKLK